MLIVYSAYIKPIALKFKNYFCATVLTDYKSEYLRDRRSHLLIFSALKSRQNGDNFLLVFLRKLLDLEKSKAGVKCVIPRDESMIKFCFQKSAWETDEESLDKRGKNPWG